jgi:hypothetical protein
VTISNPIDERHVSTEGFDQYLGSRVPVEFRIDGTPESFVFIEPIKPELGLRVAVGVDTEAPETGLSNIIARISTLNGKRFLEVVVTDSALFRDAYPVLCSMADRVQLNGLSPAAALRATLQKMSSLLLAPETMSREREIGLFGELLVLGGLISTLGVSSAVQTWRGGQAEEHDFGLPDLDIEVKTTSGEQRVHWIESLTQLVPTRERPLWLVSHQITSAGAGAGHTLSELIDLIRTAIGAGPARDRFEGAVVDSGWREEDREPLTTRWTRRTASVAYAVVGTFPRLTPDALRDTGLPLDRIPEVRYRIDLDGLTSNRDTPAIIAPTLGFEGRT